MPRYTNNSPDETQAGPGVSHKTSKKQARATHNALQGVLDWYPLPLKGRQGAASTREPKHFDMHMHDQLILKHITHLPSLTTDLLAIVDMYLEDEHQKPILLPPTTGFGFIPSRVMRTIDLKNGQDALKETEVQARQILVAKYLVPIASTLAFRLSDWHSHFFKWSLSAKGVTKAIADGYFNITADDSPSIDPHIFHGLSLIAKYFPNAAIWEFKSLVAGSKLHLDDIMTLSESPDLFPWVRCSGAGCAAHLDQDGTQVITGAPMGFDAAEPVCKLKLHPSTQAAVTCPAHSKYILQQVWAESVLQDSTFIILQCGNHEMICYRSRQENRLYISDIIEVSRTGYGKLQIGLFLAIYRDALDRALQISEAELANTLPASWIRVYGFFQGKGSTKEARKSKKKLSEVERFDLQRAAKRGARHETAVIVTSSEKHALPLGLPKRFIRIGHSGMLPSTSQLSIKIREALDCQVFRAVIQYRGTVLDQEFVVKYAHNHRDHAKLEAEFQNYSDLSHSKITGIPDIIGCFTYSESKSLRHIILVMQDVGESLVRRQAGVTISERLEYGRLLHKLHQAGYQHGDLTVDKLCFGIHGTSFIGFSELAKLETPEGRMDEFEKLARILNEIQDDYVEGVRKRVKCTAASGSSGSATSVLLLGPLTGNPISIVEQTPARLRYKVKGDFLHFEGDDEVVSSMESILISSSSYNMVPRQVIPARLNFR